MNQNILAEELEIRGTGINANLGVIYRPINELTLGFSYQSPTYFSIRTEETFTLASDVRNIQETDDPTDAFNIELNDPALGNRFINEYNLSTPSRTGFGLTYFFEKYGFFSVDAEYVNYQSNRFSNSDVSSLSQVNQDVEVLFEPVINYRAGGEFRYNIFRLRAGYAFYDDPTQFTDDTLDRDRVVISGGVGINVSSFFADLSVSRTSFESDFVPYLNGPFISQSNSQTRALLTLGFNF